MKKNRDMQSNKTECRVIRKRLEDFHDEGRRVSEEVAGHLGICNDCRDFSEFLENSGPSIMRFLDNEGNLTGKPDFPGLFSIQKKLEKRRRITMAFAGIAAAMLVTGGSYLGMHFSRQMEDYKILETETHQFVDNLFSEPLLDGVEYLSSDQ